jgi:hypothetical protein
MNFWPKIMYPKWVIASIYISVYSRGFPGPCVESTWLALVRHQLEDTQDELIS